MKAEELNEIAIKFQKMVQNDLRGERPSLTRPIKYAILDMINQITGEGRRSDANIQVAAIIRYAVDKIVPDDI